MLFGDKVKMMADERGMTQKDIVERSGLSQPLVSKVMGNHTVDPRLGTIVRIAEALGVSTSELLEGVTVGTTEKKQFVYYAAVELGDGEE